MAQHGIAPPAFRLPDAAHVGGVRLQVGDLQRSVDYYEQVVGLRTITREKDMAALGAGNRPLVSLQERAGARPVPRRGVFGLYHFALLLPDRAALGRFVAHILRSGVRFGAADHLVSEAIYLTDPDGLGIEVYADRPESGWQHAGSEIVMTTDALNLGDLQEAGGDRAWQGTPPGTVVGHVHFHVGGLAEAEAFYHRALGFDTTVWSYPGALFFAAGRYHHHVGTNTWSPGPSAADDQARLLDWELVVPNEVTVEAALRSLHDNGFPTTNQPRTTNHQPRTDRADPWGTQVRITAAA
jgi:catechol 2,3-dioxygenase